jgi:hypothetical protein
MGLIFDEMRKAGIDAEGIIRKAIRRCGREMHSQNIKKMVAGREIDGPDIEQFSFRKTMQVAFNMNPVESNKDNSQCYSYYCPLVTAWEKLGFDDETIALLCDMTMEGDRGVADAIGFKMDLGSAIGKGDETCNIHFYRGELKRGRLEQ